MGPIPLIIQADDSTLAASAQLKGSTTKQIGILTPLRLEWLRRHELASHVSDVPQPSTAGNPISFRTLPVRFSPDLIRDGRNSDRLALSQFGRARKPPLRTASP